MQIAKQHGLYFPAMATISGHDKESTLSEVFGWIAAVAGASFTIAVLIMVIDAGRYGYWNHIALEHLVSIVGLPCAAIASLILVLVLRTVAGDIEFKFLGIEFKGASGPIIMWILCFLAIALAITKTWDLTFVDKSPTASQPTPLQ